MANKYERERKIARAIELVWDSLSTHLEDTYAPTIAGVKDKKARRQIGGRKFHVRTVKEYGEILKTLTDLL